MTDASPSTPAARRLLVLGVGNLLFSDDGIGVHAVRELAKKPRATVVVRDVGTAMLDTVPLLSWADRVLVIDAMQAGERPGTIYWGRLSASAQQVSGRTVHDLDLASAMNLVAADVSRPETFVLGVEPDNLNVGWGLSVCLQAVLPQVVGIAESVLRGWRTEQSLYRATFRCHFGLIHRSAARAEER